MVFLRSCYARRALLQRRFFSSKDAGPSSEGWTLADELAAEEELGESQQSAVSKALDQMYSDLWFKKLAPGWLPLRPESSFFIPPSPPLSKIIKQYARSENPRLSIEHLRVALNPLGWTCADAIHQRMSAEPDEKVIRDSQPRGFVEIFIDGGDTDFTGGGD